MTSTTELNQLTAKELRKIARDLKIPGWHDMRKAELVRVLVQKSRTKMGREAIHARLSGKAATPTTKSNAVLDGNKRVSHAISPADRGGTGQKGRGGQKSMSGGSRSVARNTPKPTDVNERPKERRALALKGGTNANDRLALLVRDSYWLQIFWELSAKTLKRAEVALGHFWHSAYPILRLYRIDTEGSSHPRREWLRDIRIHGGVNHWYIDVDNPPSKFHVELGYLIRSQARVQKFHPLISSNTVETPQRQIVDDLEHLDGNWRGVADDLGRIFKLSSSEANNAELKKVFEEQLHRPMSGAMLTRYRASKQKIAFDKTQRNFVFNLEADLIIHGQTDPSVQVSIKSEPIPLGPEGKFMVRFPMPEKRTIFPIEAEGSDGVEMQRVVLTVERNTRVLETLFQEPSEED